MGSPGSFGIMASAADEHFHCNTDQSSSCPHLTAFTRGYIMMEDGRIVVSQGTGTLTLVPPDVVTRR